jgi:hypothetical protein
MFKKSALVLVFSISSFCFGDENGTIYGFRTEGTFTVSNYSISSLLKNANRRNTEQIENTIT